MKKYTVLVQMPMLFEVEVMATSEEQAKEQGRYEVECGMVDYHDGEQDGEARAYSATEQK